MNQLCLFGHDEAIRIERRFGSVEHIDLARGAWLDVHREWVRGHAELFEFLQQRIEWKSETRIMYDRTVEVPRRYAVLADLDSVHPVLSEIRSALDVRYGTRFARVSLALYRDGNDSVAWHGDYVARRMPNALVATVSVGAPRPFLIRPTGGGKSTSFSLGWGDLIVMGGSCQRTYVHAVPKVARADARIAIMFRPMWKEKDLDEPPTTEQATPSSSDS